MRYELMRVTSATAADIPFMATDMEMSAYRAHEVRRTAQDQAEVFLDGAIAPHGASPWNTLHQ